jgi:tagatose-1,6-bisphosphate aldolase
MQPAADATDQKTNRASTIASAACHSDRSTGETMSSEADDLEALANALIQYAASPLLAQNVQFDLIRASDAIHEHAAVLRAYEASREHAPEHR